MLRRLSSLLLLFCLTATWAVGQSSSISGTITDALSGAPLSGANVYIGELERGASADIDGNFSIADIPQGNYLVRVSFIGYRTHEELIEVGSGQNIIDIQLQAELLGLEEVVVTALGFQRETRAIGYAVQQVDGDDIAASRESNLVNALAGTVAGVQINSSGGQPGASSRITIRGNSSFLYNNQPLFVIDGIPISNDSDDNPEGSLLLTGGTSNRILDIDPNIIENISVLKGASATALYGSRAANGAVIITTKSGRQNESPVVTYSSSVGWSEAIIDGFNDEYHAGFNGEYVNGLPPGEGGYAEGGGSTFTTSSWGPHKDSVSTQVLTDLGVDEVPVYNPREDFYTTGLTYENSLSISGGTDLSNYFFTVSNTDQSGFVPGSELKRTNLTGKFGSDLSDYLSVQTSIQYTNTTNSWLSEGNGDQNYLFSLNAVPISYDIRPFENSDGSQRMHTPFSNNPLWLTENNNFSSDVNRFVSSMEVTYEILPWLSLSERLGIDTYTDKRKGRTNIGTRFYTSGMFDQKITRTQINSDLTLSAVRNLTEDFTLDVLVGNNINSREFDYDLIQGSSLNVPDFFHVSNANAVTADEESELVRLYSVYAQATLDYNDIVYLTLTARNDWSSTLPDDNNSYFYPSASVGFVFSDLLGFTDDSILSFGKLRASVSQIGNDAPAYSLSTNFVQARPSDGVRGVINYPFDGVNGYILDDDLGNPELKPEITTEYEIGTDLRFLQNRARIDFSYYSRTTRDQIFKVPLSNASGFDSRLSNAGEIKNHGIEASLGLTPLQTEAFQWDLQANFSRNRTEVVKLAPGVEDIFLGGTTSAEIRIEPEKNGYGLIWGSRYERYESGPDEGELVIRSDGTPVRAGSNGVIGHVQPDWTANLRTTFSYRSIRFSALLDKRTGGDILNYDLFYSAYYGTAKVTEQRNTSYVHEGVVGMQNGDGEWVSTGAANTTPVMRDQSYYRSFSYSYANVFENFVEDGSFLKLREVSISYTLPPSLLARTPIRSLTIKGVGRNLWIDTDFSYGDPEGNLLGNGNAQGFYHMVTPNSRSYTVSLQVSF